MGSYYFPEHDEEEEERRKRFKEGRRLSEDELLYGWARKKGTYGGIPRPELPIVNFITYKDNICTKQKKAYCVRNEECFPLKSKSTGGWNSGLIEAKDGSFLAMGFRNDNCEIPTASHKETEEENMQKENGEEVTHKSLGHLLGEDQCFNDNFNGVLGSKTKAFMFWLDDSCHENATYISFSGGRPYGGKSSGREQSQLGSSMFVYILFTVFVGAVLMRIRYGASTKVKSAENERDVPRENQDERSKLFEERRSFGIEYSSDPPVPSTEAHRTYQ